LSGGSAGLESVIAKTAVREIQISIIEVFIVPSTCLVFRNPLNMADMDSTGSMRYLTSDSTNTGFESPSLFEDDNACFWKPGLKKGLVGFSHELQPTSIDGQY